MVLFATLRRSGGIEAIARHLAIPPATARTAISSAIGPIVEAYRRYYAAAGGDWAGITHLRDLLMRFGGGRMAIEVLSPEPFDPANGGILLSELFGSTEQGCAMVHSGGIDPKIDDALLTRLLPLLAMLVGGYLAARAEGWQPDDPASAQDRARVAEFETLLTREIDPGAKPRALDDAE